VTSQTGPDSKLTSVSAGQRCWWARQGLNL
jgi:hypothetical protein